jgi:hypothetical protein
MRGDSSSERGLVRSKFPLAPFIIILALAGGIRLYSVFSESLSGDEMYHRLIITKPYLQQITSIRTDVHPPFYYWLGRAVSSIVGFGQFGLRLPSTIFGLLTVALTMLLGIRLFLGQKGGPGRYDDRPVGPSWLHSPFRRGKLSDETCAYAAKKLRKNPHERMGNFARFFWGILLDKTHGRVMGALSGGS